MELWVIRHASTAWNEERRYQGHTDQPLSEKGRSEVAAWRFHEGQQFDAVWASDLRRASDTARLLVPAAALTIAPELRELGLGVWEGRTHAEVKAETGPVLPADEWKGLDFSAPGGESLRDGMKRLERWLPRVPRGPGRALVVSHKGTIQALYALATGWDARAKPKPRPRFPHLHRFAWDGSLSVLALNEPLGET